MITPDQMVIPVISILRHADQSLQQQEQQHQEDVLRIYRQEQRVGASGRRAITVVVITRSDHHISLMLFPHPERLITRGSG